MVRDYNGDEYLEEDPYAYPGVGAPAAPAQSPQLGSFGVPENGGNPAGYMDLSYWQSRHDQGLPGAPSVDDMFDTATGQLKPGWKRTAKGYEYVGMTATPPPTSPPLYPNYPTTYPTGSNNIGTIMFNPYEFQRNWTQFEPRQFSFDAMPVYQPKYGAYESPTLQEASQEPGYTFGRDQAIQSYMNSAAGRGSLRSGQSTNDILRLANNFAESNYANVDARKYRNWQGNVAQDMQNYMTNRDTHQGNFGIASGVFDRNYKGDFDRFRGVRESEQSEFDAAIRAYLSKISALTSIAGSDI